MKPTLKDIYSLIAILTLALFALLFLLAFAPTAHAGILSSLGKGLGLGRQAVALSKEGYDFRGVKRDGPEKYPVPYILMVERITKEVVLTCRKDPNCMDIGQFDDEDKAAYRADKKEGAQQ